MKGFWVVAATGRWGGMEEGGGQQDCSFCIDAWLSDVLIQCAYSDSFALAFPLS